MRAWRWAMAVVLLGVIGVPVLLPLAALAGQPEAWRALREPGRLAELAGQTLLLTGGTLAVALPLGVLGGVLLSRSDLPAAGFFRFLTLLTLFVPLPLFASAWQAVLGAAGFGQPWAAGIVPAMLIHAAAGLPWVIWIVGLGLAGVDRALEEDALLDGGPWRVFWLVTLPQARPALAAAALWVALQTATEITVTDMMLVRTFAEEVYTQLVTAGGTEQARALAVSLPAVLLTVGVVLLVVQRWEAALPAAGSGRDPLCLIRLGRWRWPTLAGVSGAAAVLLGTPLLGLVSRAGRGGAPPRWSAGRMGEQLARALTDEVGLLGDSLGLAVLAGTLTAALALAACWLALECRSFRWLVMALLAVVWSLPGPVVGLGLKQAIEGLLRIEELLGNPGLLRRWLYDGPSLAPLVWTTMVRFFPAAVAILWPAVRSIPLAWRESARLDGARPADELRQLIWPLSRSATAVAALAVGILSLGELAAGKLAATPGCSTFAHRIFTEMHYGVTPGLAALCLVVLLLVSAGAMLLRWKLLARRRI